MFLTLLCITQCKFPGGFVPHQTSLSHLNFHRETPPRMDMRGGNGAQSLQYKMKWSEVLFRSLYAHVVHELILKEMRWVLFSDFWNVCRCLFFMLYPVLILTAVQCHTVPSWSDRLPICSRFTVADRRRPQLWAIGFQDTTPIPSSPLIITAHQRLIRAMASRERGKREVRCSLAYFFRLFCTPSCRLTGRLWSADGVGTCILSDCTHWHHFVLFWVSCPEGVCYSILVPDPFPALSTLEININLQDTALQGSPLSTTKLEYTLFFVTELQCFEEF